MEEEEKICPAEMSNKDFHEYLQVLLKAMIKQKLELQQDCMVIRRDCTENIRKG